MDMTYEDIFENIFKKFPNAINFKDSIIKDERNFYPTAVLARDVFTPRPIFAGNEIIYHIRNNLPIKYNGKTYYNPDKLTGIIKKVPPMGRTKYFNYPKEIQDLILDKISKKLTSLGYQVNKLEIEDLGEVDLLVINLSW